MTPTELAAFMESNCNAPPPIAVWDRWESASPAFRLGAKDGYAREDRWPGTEFPNDYEDGYVVGLYARFLVDGNP